MKNLKSKEDREKILELKNLIDTLKELTKREKELKEHFKNKVDGVVQCNGVLICVDEKSRTSLDKKELTIFLGDKIKEYEKTTNFKTLTLKEAA